MNQEKTSQDIRIPRQQRSRERVEAILEAVKSLIIEKGSAGLKIQEIAQRAEVTPGSMYQYFPNKTAIMQALTKQYLDQFHDMVQATLSEKPKDLRECVELLNLLFDQFYQVNCDDPILRDIWLSISDDKAMREMDHRSTQKNATLLFETFKHLFSEEHWGELKRYFLIVVQITPSAIQLALMSDAEEAADIMNITKRMVSASLLSWADE